MKSSLDISDPTALAILDTFFASDSPVGKAILDRDLRYARINQTLADFNGKLIDEHIGRKVQDVLPQAYDALKPIFQRVLETGSREEFHIQVETPNAPGELSEWEASYFPIRVAGKVEGIYVQAVNLTAKVRAERALRDSASQLRRVLDSLFAFVGVLNVDGTLIEANKAPLEAAGIKADEVIGRPFWDTFWWNYDSNVQSWLKLACERARMGEVVREDVTVRMMGDTRMMLDFMLVPLRDDEGRITHLIPSAIDISDRLAAQKRIENALKERTILLQEVHHRVKNNLQIIASLLRLQARNAGPEVSNALQDSQNRVMAMALTHQLLYERSDFSALEIGPYLRKLVTSLRELHGDFVKRVELVIEALDTGISINLQQAIPIALIVNELLTNALKHGFPNEGQGSIMLSATREKNMLKISVKDSGIGISNNRDVRGTQTLGFSLIRLLVEQLHATMQWPDPGGPAAFTLLIPQPKEQA